MNVLRRFIEITGINRPLGPMDACHLLERYGNSGRFVDRQFHHTLGSEKYAAPILSLTTYRASGDVFS